jgi:SAM-dependent methyltransferase
LNKNDQKCANVDSWDARYREYQRKLTARYLIPVLSAWSVSFEGKRLLEIGCGDGGCAAEFYRAGCSVTALDIDERLVNIARALNSREELNINAYVGDVRDGRCPGFDEGPFDIVVLRDVVEHLDPLVPVLENLKKHLASDGVVFAVFPPYYSPYGAHQQLLLRKKFGFIPYNKLPYIQLLPDAMFDTIVGDETVRSGEVKEIRGIRLTLRKFEKQVAAAGLAVRRKKFYLTRPTFKLRYGVPVIGAGILGRIPLLRELFVTAGYYLLEKESL